MNDLIVIIGLSFAIINTLVGITNWFARIGTTSALIYLMIAIWHN